MGERMSEITIYWAPSHNDDDGNPYNMLYRTPESLLSFIHGEKTPAASQQQCPAMKDRLTNVFVLRSAIDEVFDFNPAVIEETQMHTERRVRYDVGSTVDVTKIRESNLNGYYPITYNMNWVFFASEPVKMKFTAPYYPAVSPVRGAVMATGEYDIGRWYRNATLDYHIPFGEYHFEIRKGDPLAFVEFETDKKIVFKRYEMNDTLLKYHYESVLSMERYGYNKPLEERYEMAEAAELPKMILSEIKKQAIS